MSARSHRAVSQHARTQHGRTHMRHGWTSRCYRTAVYSPPVLVAHARCVGVRRVSYRFTPRPLGGVLAVIGSYSDTASWIPSELGGEHLAPTVLYTCVSYDSVSRLVSSHDVCGAGEWCETCARARVERSAHSGQIRLSLEKKD